MRRGHAARTASSVLGSFRIFSRQEEENRNTLQVHLDANRADGVFSFYVQFRLQAQVGKFCLFFFFLIKVVSIFSRNREFFFLLLEPSLKIEHIRKMLSGKFSGKQLLLTIIIKLLNEYVFFFLSGTKSSCAAFAKAKN